MALLCPLAPVRTRRRQAARPSRTRHDAVTPNAGFTGSDRFTYDLSDGTLTSDPATITISVKPTNTAPTAADLSYTLAHDTSLSTSGDSGVLSAASDADGDPLTAVLVSGPAHGTLQLSGDGSFGYTPDAGYNGTDSFTFKAFDGTAYSDPATATLTVTNDVPTANPDSYSVLSSGTTTVSADNGVLANDTDGEDDPLTAVLVSGPAHGNLTLNSSDGSFTYTPDGSFTGSDSFTYQASDGVNVSLPVTVTLTTAPVASDQFYGATHDQTLTVDATDGLLTGASDANSDTLTAVLASGPSHGTLTVNSDGSFSYTPTTHFVGSDSFTYTVSDGTNTSVPATVTLNVTNTVPQTSPQSWDTPQDTALTVSPSDGVLASSSDDDGDTLMAQMVSGPSNGSLTLSSGGNFTYTPNAGFFGTDSFTYDVTDGIATSEPATVTIGVNEVLSQSNNDFRAVATGDFNNDGNADFVAANYGTNSVSVFLGNGDGTFQTPVAYSVGNGPLAVAVGDFGNGAEDIAVANSLDGTVTILMNNGSGSFTTSQVAGVGTDPVSLAVGNFLNDGVLDLAVANEGSNTVSILQNDGSGVFSVVSTLNVGNAPDSVALGDLNGDGVDDLVVANAGDSTISVLLNNGSGTFASPVNYAVGGGPTSVAVADLSGDGKLDVVVANGGSNNVTVLLGNGDGTLAAPVNYAAGSNPVAVAVGDFNGDGLADLGVVNRGSNDDTELFNAGGGVFLLARTNPLGESPSDMAVADFNKDGLADQIVDQAPQEIKGEKLYPQTDGLAISQDSNASYAAGFSRPGHVILVWNVDKMSGVSRIALPAGTTSAPMAFCPTDPNLLAVGIGGKVMIYNIQDPSAPVATATYLDGKVPISALAFSKDGTKLAVGASKADPDKGRIVGMVWNITVDAGKHTLTINGAGSPLDHPRFEPVKQIAITKDSRLDNVGYTVTAIDSSSIQTWYSTGGGPYKEASNVSYTPLPGFTLQPTAIGFSEQPDAGLAQWLIVGYEKGQLAIFQRSANGVLSRAPAATYSDDSAAVVAVGFNQEGEPMKIDTLGLGTYKIVNAGGGLLRLQSHGGFAYGATNGGISSGTVSATGKFVFIGGKDGLVKVYYASDAPPLEKKGESVKVGDTSIILRS